MSHAFCSKCKKAISCTKELCTKYKLKATGKADAAGFIGLCDDCSEALPAGTPSDYIEGVKESLKNIQKELDVITGDIMDLSKERKELMSQKEALITELFRYEPDLEDL